MDSDARTDGGSRAVDTWNRIFDALAAAPRRQLLTSLLDASPDGTVELSVDDLTPAGSTDSDSFRVALVHRHLPLLSDHEFVAWESEPLVARRGPRFDALVPILEAMVRATADPLDDPVAGRPDVDRDRRPSHSE